MIYKFSELGQFAQEVARRSRDIVTVSHIEARRSLVEGSELTGAPGQPVDTGNLASSFIDERPGPLEARTTTNVEYAEAVEDGVQAPYVNANGTVVTPRPMVFKSAVGGAHSLALTRAGWQNIVDAVAQSVVPQ